MAQGPRLRPCPFCGANEAYVLDAHTVSGQILFVCCQPCGACGPDAEDVTGAVDLWNKRAASRHRKRRLRLPFPLWFPSHGGDRGGTSSHYTPFSQTSFAIPPPLAYPSLP